MEQCIFCKIVEKEMSAEVVHETENVVAFRDVAPVAPVHILVIPKAHIPSIEDLDDNQRQTLLPEIFQVIHHLTKQENLGNKGFRIVNNYGKEGGQTVQHLHFHLLGGRFMQWPPG